MNKCSIITLSHFNNYGSVLQTYSTQTVLEKNGHNVEIITYIPQYKNNKSSSVSLPSKIITFVSNQGVNRLIHAIIARVFLNKHYMTQREVFKSFRESYLHMTKNIYSSLEELNQNPPTSDIYIAGSDNLWSVNDGGITTRNLPYYLPFAPHDKVRIAYAVSMGDPNVPEEYKDEFIRLLNNIDSISIRGKISAEYVSKLIKRDAADVLDPTLLLTKDNWTQQFNLTETSNKPYVLVYIIYELPKSAEVFAFIKSFSRMHNLAVKYIGYHYKSFIPKYTDVSVAEFLQLFKNAAYVITTSFHGTLFAINFRKSFYTFPPLDKPSRISDMLESIDLSKRFISTSDEAMKLPDSIDYTIPGQKLEALRTFSLNWLMDAVSKKKQENKNANSN